MSDTLYQVIFQAETAPDFAIGDVKKNLAALFKAPPEKIDQLFSGKPVPIKKNVDHATALRYQAAMERAGAVSEVIPAGHVEKQPPAADVTGKSARLNIIVTEKVRGKLAFSPIPCTAISGNA